MAIADAPAFANEMAIARPIPLDAPLMKTALPRWLDCVLGSISG
jgi:hypothetical protein